MELTCSQSWPEWERSLRAAGRSAGSGKDRSGATRTRPSAVSGDGSLPGVPGSSPGSGRRFDRDTIETATNQQPCQPTATGTRTLIILVSNVYIDFCIPYHGILERLARMQRAISLKKTAPRPLHVGCPVRAPNGLESALFRPAFPAENLPHVLVPRWRSTRCRPGRAPGPKGTRTAHRPRSCGPR